MKFIFLTKRQYMQKDVIDDRYARLYELPNQLALQGHQVLGYCISYRKRKEGIFQHYQNGNSALFWHSYNLGTFIFFGLFQYLYSIFSISRKIKPDILLGSSDCLITVLTAFISYCTGIPYFIDLYDNYESFGLAKIPGIIPLYRQAIRNATGVCCVSEPLSVHIRERYGHQNTLTLESTISGGVFYVGSKKKARAELNLPLHAKIIGIAGSLDKGRGINLLYDSFMQLSERIPDLHLALAGKPDSTIPIPQHPRIHYFGLLPHKDIVRFYNALDLAVVCMRDTEFGRYAFPQKTYEILACKTPIVAANLGSLAQAFKDYPQCLYEPDNQGDLQAKIENLLQNPVNIDIPIPTWQDQATKLITWMQASLKITTQQ